MSDTVSDAGHAHNEILALRLSADTDGRPVRGIFDRTVEEPRSRDVLRVRNTVSDAGHAWMTVFVRGARRRPTCGR